MHRCVASLMAFAACVLAGCGMAESGGEIQVAPEDVSGPAGAATGGTLNLPLDRPFNIHLKSSSQSPGAAGRARGDSDATAEGQAFALAEAGGGGSAAGEFRLGQRVRAGGGRTWRASIQVAFQLRQSLQASLQPAPRTAATASLQLLVLDSRKRVLSRSPLIETTSDDAVGSASEIHERRVAAVLEADETCDIMLYGKVEASAAPDQDSAARLDVRQLKMLIDFQPLATQPSGAPGASRPAN